MPTRFEGSVVLPGRAPYNRLAPLDGLVQYDGATLASQADEIVSHASRSMLSDASLRLTTIRSVRDKGVVGLLTSPLPPAE
jgi:hypothetical protein